MRQEFSRAAHWRDLTGSWLTTSRKGYERPAAVARLLGDAGPAHAQATSGGRAWRTRIQVLSWSRSSGTLLGVARRVRRRVRPTPLERRVALLDLGPGDVAIDCGANVGDVTAAFARRGAFVHAFEPNPHAFVALQERFQANPDVELHQRAVLDHAGTARLYLHVDADVDPLGASRGSSVLPFKGNIDAETWVDVAAVDLSEFVLQLARPVKVLKIDVEGAECPIVNQLLDTGAIERVTTVLVELHDRHIPELVPQYDLLRERIEREGLTERVRTDWD